MTSPPVSRIPTGQRAVYVATVLLYAAFLAVLAACAGLDTVPPTTAEPTHPGPSPASLPTLIDNIPTPEPNPTPTPPAARADDIRWLLQSLDGSPLIDGTHITLSLNRDSYSGFDGCNTFGGRHDDGTPVASPDGAFAAPSETVSTLIGCQDPKGILDQADAYMAALRQSSNYRLIDELMLETLDATGQVRLVFVSQEPLPGTPARLEGTSWRLIGEDATDNGMRMPTLTFLDVHLYEGTTACRAVAGSYQTSGKSIRFPSIGMSGDHSTCSTEVMQHEGQFTDDLSYAIEYSVFWHEETKRLVLRTSRGRTLTFESLPASPSQ